MKRLKKILMIMLVILGIVLLVFVFWARDRYVVPILTYHNVAEERGPYALNNVGPKAFAWQMEFLRKRHYHVITFDDYVQGVKKGVGFARNTVVIHFDDGYADNYTNAFPILKKYHMPASIFIVSDKIGNDPHYLTWDQVKEMSKQGIDFGSHTRHHAYLPDADHAKLVDEIAGSKKIIEQNLGLPVKYLVYPSGGYSDAAIEVAREAGYEAAATTNRGRDVFNRELFELNRIRVKNGETALTFWAKLSGYYNLFRSKKCGKHCRKD